MPSGIPGKPIITCLGCQQEREHYAKGQCRPCYNRPRTRRWRRENPEKAKAYGHYWQQNNPEKVSAKKQRFLKKHKERINAKRREEHTANPERRRDADRYWREKNPEKARAIVERRRARKQALPDTLSAEEVKEILGMGRCFYCGSAEHLTLDHFVPLDGGGGTTRANIVLACLSCNDRKGTKMPREILTQLRMTEA